MAKKLINSPVPRSVTFQREVYSSTVSKFGKQNCRFLNLDRFHSMSSFNFSFQNASSKIVYNLQTQEDLSFTWEFDFGFLSIINTERIQLFLLVSHLSHFFSERASVMIIRVGEFFLANESYSSAVLKIREAKLRVPQLWPIHFILISPPFLKIYSTNFRVRKVFLLPRNLILLLAFNLGIKVVIFSTLTIQIIISVPHPWTLLRQLSYSARIFISRKVFLSLQIYFWSSFERFLQSLNSAWFLSSLNSANLLLPCLVIFCMPWLRNRI